LGLVT